MKREEVKREQLPTACGGIEGGRNPNLTQMTKGGCWKGGKMGCLASRMLGHRGITAG